MRLNKVFMGIALGVVLISGASGTKAEAKTSVVTVKVDKADSATAKKVDAALKKGKAVTLKVRGSKKASKKLLVKLQDEVAKANVFGARFDLDNGDEKYAGKGNVFQTYRNLSYKQSGNYGCYTITKSTANAYKYYLKGANKTYKEQTARFSEEKYNAMVEKLKADAAKDNLAEIYEKLYVFAETYIKEHTDGLGDLSDLRDACHVLAKHVFGTEVSDGELESAMSSLESLFLLYADSTGVANYDYKGYVDFCSILFNEAESYKSIVDEKVPEIPSRYEYAVEIVGESMADYYFGKVKYINPKTLWRPYIGYRVYNYEDWLDFYYTAPLYWGTDEYRMKELYKGTKGVCAELAVCDRMLFDYCGIKSSYVANNDVNHAICVANPSEFGESGWLIVCSNSQYGKGGDLNRYYYLFTESGFKKQVSTSYSHKTWLKLIKKAMGKDCPF